MKRSIVDAHIHLFDPTRPGGVPWPTPKDHVLYRPALPARYRALATPLGVCAAIAIECSPLRADNDWLLRTAASDDLIVGVIGDLDPEAESFSADLARLAENPLFLGIRSGNLWKRDLHASLAKPRVLENLRDLAHRDLVFESANPDPQLVADLLTIARAVPQLRIVIDHLPQAVPPQNAGAARAYLDTLTELSRCPRVYVKGSEILRLDAGQVSSSVIAYEPWLDQLWERFGEDRIFFGSDWPNSDTVSPVQMVFDVAHAYFDSKGPTAAEKYFTKNSATIYRWLPRNPEQQAARFGVTAAPAQRRTNES